MPFLLLAAGIIIIVAAVRNTYKQLGTALATDVPGFTVWAAAVFAVAAIGWIPGMKSVSRGLMTLVLLVLVLSNYSNIVAGFTNAWQTPASPANSGGSTSTTTGNQGLVGGSSSPLTLGPTTSGSGIGGTDNPSSYDEIIP